MDAVKTVNLTKTYRDVTAVDHVNLQIPKGELFALLGMNGAGKTTTVHMLCCLTAPTSGEAFVQGHSILRDASSIKQVIGISPQETAVAPHLSVEENLALMCGICGLSKEARKEKVEQLIAAFTLSPIRHKKAGKLSGGWQRRLSIAMALVGEPSVLFLDEPTLGLDVIARRELWDEIRALKGSVTVILTTHYMEEAATLADRIGVMKHGKLIAVGTVQELMNATHTDNLEQAFITLVKEDIA